MRRLFTTIAVVLFATGLLFAGGGWATSAISITKDGGTAYSYPIDLEEGWTDGDWILNTIFEGKNFGSPTSLILNGGYGNGWTDDSPGYTSASFILYYRVYKNGTTPGSWSQIALDNQYYKTGNNYIYSKTNANVDILALATLPGTNTYTLEVTMSKNQFYTGGNWNSMIPSGQATAYNANNAGYKATFTKSITTKLINLITKTTVKCNNRNISAQFSGNAKVELYSLSGQLLYRTTAENYFNYAVKQGIYFLRVNAEKFKVVAQ